MSRALVTINLELEAEPEQLVSVIERLEIALRAYLEYKLTVHRYSVATRNTFPPRPDALESGPDVASPTERHGEDCRCDTCMEESFRMSMEHANKVDHEGSL